MSRKLIWIVRAVSLLMIFALAVTIGNFFNAYVGIGIWFLGFLIYGYVMGKADAKDKAC